MKKVIILLLVCLLVFSGCVKEDVEQDKAEVETSPEPEVPEENQPPEVEQGNEAPFGLTEKEIEWIDNYLSSRPFNVSFDDLVRVDRIPNENIPTMSGEVNDSNRHYALHFKDGLFIQICIPVEDLEN